MLITEIDDPFSSFEKSIGDKWCSKCKLYHGKVHDALDANEGENIFDQQ